MQQSIPFLRHTKREHLLIKKGKNVFMGFRGGGLKTDNNR